MQYQLPGSPIYHVCSPEQLEKDCQTRVKYSDNGWVLYAPSRTKLALLGRYRRKQLRANDIHTGTAPT